MQVTKRKPRAQASTAHRIHDATYWSWDDVPMLQWAPPWRIIIDTDIRPALGAVIAFGLWIWIGIQFWQWLAM